VFYVEATATQAGTLNVSTNVPEGFFSINTLFGLDDDLTNSTSLGSGQIEIVDDPDLVVTAFDALTDHVLLGQTSVTFKIENLGLGAAGAFAVDLVHSDNDVIGDSDDVVIRTLNYSGLAGGASFVDTVDVQLDVGTLASRAKIEDPVLPSLGTVSSSFEFVGIVVDPLDDIVELDESNNRNQGKGVDKDDVTYFAWDYNDDGGVNALDSVFVFNRLGELTPPGDERADIDGNGGVTPLDFIAVFNRLGYLINGSVIETPLVLTGDPAPLLLDGGPTVGAPDADTLFAEALDPIVEEALLRWSQSSLTTLDADQALAEVTVEIEDLPDLTLGFTDGNRIVVDVDAAGAGWFVDPTPWNDAEFFISATDSEFYAKPGNSAAFHVDLLTVVMHEFGHVIGLEDHAPSQSGPVLMQDRLAVGVRRVPPAAEDSELAALPPANPASDAGNTVVSEVIATNPIEVTTFNGKSQPPSSPPQPTKFEDFPASIRPIPLTFGEEFTKAASGSTGLAQIDSLFALPIWDETKSLQSLAEVRGNNGYTPAKVIPKFKEALDDPEGSSMSNKKSETHEENVAELDSQILQELFSSDALLQELNI
jgi:hypothetical protein